MDQIRDQLLEEVRKFFVGPRSKNDPLPKGNTPLDMYTTGILFPMNAPQEDLDKESKDGEEGKEDSNTEEESEKFFKQNSIGLRVELEDGIKKIQLSVNYGKYLPNADGIWERNELDSKNQTHEIDLSRKEEGVIDILDNANLLESKIWWKIYNGTVLNVFLENPTIWEEPDDEKKTKDRLTGKSKKEKIDYKEATRRNNLHSVFQPSISLQTNDNTHPFKPISTGSKFYKSVEDDLFDMLYRNKKVFGAGYGCAAEWDTNDEPTYVRTILIPTFHEDEIEKFAEDENDPLRPARIDMYDLSCFENLDDYESNRKTIREKISPLIEKYKKMDLTTEKNY